MSKAEIIFTILIVFFAVLALIDLVYNENIPKETIK
jgi:hypothetical protein